MFPSPRPLIVAALCALGALTSAAEIPPIAAASRAGLPGERSGAAAAEQIGGAYADGAGPHVASRAGDWRLANERIELIFANVDDSLATHSMPLAGWHPVYNAATRLPGALIDASFDGKNLDFVSFFTQSTRDAARSPRIQYDAVEPVREGDRVGVRFEGTPFESTLARLSTTYWIRAGEDSVSIESAWSGLAQGEVPPQIFDAAAWTVGVAMDQNNGFVFRGTDSGLSGGYVAVSGGAWTLAVAPATGALTGRYNAADDIYRIAIPRTNDRPSSSGLAARRLWFGASDFASVHEKIMASRGETLSPIVGRIKADATTATLSSDPVSISVFKLTLEGSTTVAAPDGSIVHLPGRMRGLPRLQTIAHSRADGTYSINLPPGGYVLAPFITLDPRQAYGNIILLQQGQPSTFNMAIPGASRIAVTVLDDATSQPLSARVSFEPLPPTPSFWWEPADGDLRYGNAAYVSPSNPTLELPAGKYVMRTIHGPRYRMQEALVDIPAGGLTSATLRLKVVSPTPGWVGVEMGARTSATPGVSITPEQYVAMAAAEDLEWIVSGDFEAATDFAPVIAKLGLEGKLKSSRGFRTMLPAHPEYGHLFVFPLAAGDPDPAVARKDWASAKNSKEWLAAIRKRYPAALIQVDDPVTFDGTGYFSRGGKDINVASWDPAPDADLSFDALNIMPARISIPFEGLSALWYNNLARGRNYIGSTAPMGTSMIGGEPGYPRLLALVGDVKLADLTEDRLFKAIRERRTQLTNGPFIQMDSEGALPGDTIKYDPARKVRLRVTSNNWNPASIISIDKDGNHQLKLVVNMDNETFQRFPQPETGNEWYETTLGQLQYLTSKDTLLDARATGLIGLDGGLPGYAPGFANLPVALIAPIVVDANGNGRYDPLTAYGDRGQ